MSQVEIISRISGAMKIVIFSFFLLNSFFSNVLIFFLIVVFEKLEMK